MAKENSPAQAGMTETVVIGARSPSNLTECLDGEMLARILQPQSSGIERPGPLSKGREVLCVSL